jgi:hypothetical protein
MLEVLQFIFSSFWVWLGTVIILQSVGQSFRGVITYIRSKP